MTREILKAMMKAKENNSWINCFGLRTENRELNVGDELGCSLAWDEENDRPYEDKYLDGICATGFGYLWLIDEDDEDDLKAIEKAIEIHSAYNGAHTYLVAGTGFEYGNDEEEIVIAGSEVIAVIA